MHPQSNPLFLTWDWRQLDYGLPCQDSCLHSLQHLKVLWRCYRVWQQNPVKWKRTNEGRAIWKGDRAAVKRDRLWPQREPPSPGRKMVLSLPLIFHLVKPHNHAWMWTQKPARSKRGCAEIKAGRDVLPPHAPEPQTLAEKSLGTNGAHPFSPFRLQIRSERAALEIVGEIAPWPFYSLLQIDKFVGKGWLTGSGTDRDLQTPAKRRERKDRREAEMMWERRTFMITAPVGLVIFIYFYCSYDLFPANFSVT